jgi:dephospho-CoA kinase
MSSDLITIQSRVPLVGLTGGIASGKSTAAELFGELGIEIIDTDHLAHLITGPGGAAIPAIIENFGEAFLDDQGALNRSRMREDVFNSIEHRKLLEDIMHPMIREAVEHRVAYAHSSYAIVVVPLLYESAFFKERVDRILVVDCEEETQIQRALKRSGLTSEILKGIMKAQANRSQRLSIADDIIQNNGNLEALKDQVMGLDARYRQLFAS